MRPVLPPCSTEALKIRYAALGGVLSGDGSLAVMVESDVVGGPSVSSSRKWFRLRVLAARLADQARRLIGDLVRPQ